MTTYQDAKIYQDFLMARVKDAGVILRSVPGVGSGLMGLTPDDVKSRADYKAAKGSFDRAFNELRVFNRAFTKEFKAEIRADRKTKYERN